MAVIIAYLVNLGIPRAGEFSRAAALTEYEDVPFEKGFGTIVAERVADVLMLILFVALAFFAQYDLIKMTLADKLPENPIYSVFAVGIMVLLGYLFIKLIKKSEKTVFHKTQNVYFWPYLLE